MPDKAAFVSGALRCVQPLPGKPGKKGFKL